MSGMKKEKKSHRKHKGEAEGGGGDGGGLEISHQPPPPEGCSSSASTPPASPGDLSNGSPQNNATSSTESSPVAGHRKTPIKGRKAARAALRASGGGFEVDVGGAAASPPKETPPNSVPASPLARKSTASLPSDVALFVGVADFADLACPRALRLAVTGETSVSGVILAILKKPSVGLDGLSPAEATSRFALFRTAADGGDRLHDVEKSMKDLVIANGSQLIILDISKGATRPTNEQELFPSNTAPRAVSPAVAIIAAGSEGEEKPKSRRMSLKAAVRTKRNSMSLGSSPPIIDGSESILDAILQGTLMVRSVKKRNKFSKRWVVLNKKSLFVFKHKGHHGPPLLLWSLETISPKIMNDGKVMMIRLFSPIGEFDFQSGETAPEKVTEEIMLWNQVLENAHANIMNETVGNTDDRRDVLGTGEEVEKSPSSGVMLSMFSAPPTRAPTITEVQNSEGNDACADCGSTPAPWGSTNLGIFVCIDCCGAHRSLGTHVSKMRSCEMDSWTTAQVEHMKAAGNRKMNAEYLAFVPTFVRTPTRDTDMEERIQFARAKWDKKWFLA